MPSDTTSAISAAPNGVQLPTENKGLREQVLRRLMKVGCACVPDLVNELDVATKKDLDSVVEGLLRDGLIRPLSDEQDPREYKDATTVYELVK
jgi:hypothetical protein